MLADRQGLEHLRNISLALSLHVQEWIEWQGAGKEFPLELTLAVPTWMSRWKPISAAAIKKAPSRSLLDVMPSTDADRASMRAIEQVCDQADKLALVVPEGRQLSIILVPTRLEFMQWNGYSGLLDPTQQAANWCDDSAQWTQFWHGWHLVLALEYASW